MNLEDEIIKYEHEFVYHSRRATEKAAEHQSAKEIQKAMAIRLKELKAKKKERDKK